jgi:CheY-like chemotaxis protein
MGVLIVDDDAAMREALCDTLELQGHRTSGVSNGREALDHLERSEAPCLILLDMMMPLMNGWEFREAQLKNPRIASIPVVVITAYSKIQNVDRLDAVGYLMKPISPERLLQVVAEWCPPEESRPIPD